MPTGQLHTGIWLYTLQIAFWPQVPIQGSLHLFLMQASWGLQSLLLTHSGLQPVYGSPWYSWIQVHIPFVHSALIPHGNGMHGLWVSNTGTRYTFIITFYNYI